MNFGDALEQLKKGEKVCREGWNGKNMYIALHVPLPERKINTPYIYMKPQNGGLVPWTASQTDILSPDWKIYNDKNIDITIDKNKIIR